MPESMRGSEHATHTGDLRGSEHATAAQLVVGGQEDPPADATPAYFIGGPLEGPRSLTRTPTVHMAFHLARPEPYWGDSTDLADLAPPARVVLHRYRRVAVTFVAGADRPVALYAYAGQEDPPADAA